MSGDLIDGAEVVLHKNQFSLAVPAQDYPSIEPTNYRRLVTLCNECEGRMMVMSDDAMYELVFAATLDFLEVCAFFGK